MISVIIVTYNSAETIEACLNSLRDGIDVQPNVDCEVIVVDNASNDGTADLIKQKFSNVVLVSRSENVGFARAVNQGAQIAKGECLLVLNPDTVAGKNLLGILSDFLTMHSDAAIAVPRILHAHGAPQASVWDFPTLGSLLIEMVFPHFIALPLTDKTPRSAVDPVEISAASGAALCIRKSHFNLLDGLDERFFMYYEDIDFCLRTRQVGSKVFFVPAAEVCHHQGKSSWQDPGSFFLRFYTSKLHYWKKHAPVGRSGPARQIIVKGLMWKRFFYGFFGAVLFRPDLKVLGRRYGETRKKLLVAG